MDKQLMELVLPRLAQRLHRQLKRYRSGELDDAEFTRNFEDLLQKQYAWLSKQGVPEEEAAVAIHGAVLVLSSPGLRAEAAELGVPLEVVEFSAVRTAADDIASNYGLSKTRTLRQLTSIIAQYAE
jgi:hypothetical protein